MVEVRAFIPEDLAALDLAQPEVTGLATLADWRAMARQAAQAGPAWTVVIGARVVACAGFAIAWPGRAVAWCFIGRGIPRWAWTALHRAVLVRLRQLPALGIRRVEAEVLAGYAAGHRWVRLLGFRHEGAMPAYGPGGEDFHRYARVFAA